mmetsp:Transcript_115416/g.337504  ORF Transcript_115416/g.337504 Transcript_115416/m.337504 type:complete len:199 (-) Transcript_115416:58-654(-)
MFEPLPGCRVEWFHSRHVSTVTRLGSMAVLPRLGRISNETGQCLEQLAAPCWLELKRGPLQAFWAVDSKHFRLELCLDSAIHGLTLASAPASWYSEGGAQCCTCRGVRVAGYSGTMLCIVSLLMKNVLNMAKQMVLTSRSKPRGEEARLPVLGSSLLRTPTARSRTPASSRRNGCAACSACHGCLACQAGAMGGTFHC